MADDSQVIDDDGDVVFIVGAIKKKLKVSPATLSMVSPVFEALLGPHFRQTERSTAQPVEIDLPDDQPNSITNLCELLHLRRISEEWAAAKVDSEAALDLAIVIDKYDVADVLRFQMQGLLLAWYADHGLDCTMTEASNMIADAYLLGQTRAFSMITKRIPDCAFFAPSGLLRERFGGLYPTSVLLALCERRMSGLEYQTGLCLRCARENTDIVDTCLKHPVF